MKKAFKITALIIGVGVSLILLTGFIFTITEDPLEKSVKIIVKSLNEKDRVTFDQYVDLQQLSDNISKSATEETAPNWLSGLEGNPDVDISFLKDLVSGYTSGRYIELVDLYFQGQGDINGPLKFLLDIDGKAIRTKITKTETNGTLTYIPPSGVNDTEKSYIFEKRGEYWVLVNAIK
jgi:hypothetical protein